MLTTILLAWWADIYNGYVTLRNAARPRPAQQPPQPVIEPVVVNLPLAA
ncbi:MAG: hypothetical protein KC910_05390 [Candidatus Eremiobacteraeota bacterium]|nr:hypothetical protein [Candidatus Eremiobacteraeota bacterium]